MVELPAGAGEVRTLIDEPHRDVGALPDLFDFLSDGPGQREGLGLNLFDGHRPTVTAEGKQLVLSGF